MIVLQLTQGAKEFAINGIDSVASHSDVVKTWMRCVNGGLIRFFCTFVHAITLYAIFQTEKILEKIDTLHLEFAKRAAPFNNW